MKICIIGHTCSGKTTLAKKLSEKYSLPVLHLDNTYWGADGQERTREEQSVLVAQFMEENEGGWIIDGNYFEVCPIRFEDCDKTYFLDFGGFLCYRRARKRYKETFGQKRDDCPVDDTLDFSTLLWTLHYCRTEEMYEEYANILNRGEGEKLTFEKPRDLEKHLESLDK